MASTSDVSQLVISTPPQSVAPGALSDAITIQTQNTEGTPVSVSETQHFNLRSSSQTGQFVTSTGNPISTFYISKDTTQRTFYYRDATAGTYAITVTGVEHPAWVATQEIVVGSGGSPTGEETGNGEEGAEGEEAEVSAYAGAATLSKPAKPSKPLTVDPGRRRLVSVGVPVNFRAKVTGGVNDGRSQIIRWSFGDGDSALGREVAHAYFFPGTYIVMVNVEQAEDEAVGEVKVEVVEPKAVVGEIGLTPRPYVQIVNHSAKELNLGYWQLRAGDRALTLPADTLIAANAKVNIPVDPAKLNLAAAPALELVYPNGQVIDQKPSPAAVPPAAIPTIRALNQRLETLAKKPVLAATPPKIQTPVPALPSAPTSLAATPTPVRVLVLPKAENLWSRALNKLF